VGRKGGHALAGVSVELMDEEGQEMSHGRYGHLRWRATTCCKAMRPARENKRNSPCGY